MKQIIAIIRDEQIEMTKLSLESIGLRGITFLYVTGRGQQKGKVSTQELGTSLNRHMRMQLESVPPGNHPKDSKTGVAGSPFYPDSVFVFSFLPKRMLIIVAHDVDINRIVQAIVDANQTGRHGDGRIFICPMISAIRIRTGEQSDKALS